MLLSAHDIALACQGRLVAPGVDLSRMVCDLSWDSRTVKADMLYVALEGERVDGHDFCVSAAQQQAAALLIQHALPDADMQSIAQAGAAVIEVADCQAALGLLATFWRDQLDATVLALTGSSGKTTTKTLVRDVLATAGNTIATRGNQNNELGVPATVLHADKDTQYLVVEMGMRGQGQLAQLCDFVRPAWALVTNVGTSHIELLGSRDAIARAKAEPFVFLPEDGVAFINAHDAFATALVDYGQLASRGIETVFFDGSGVDPLSYKDALRPLVYASDISFDDLGNPHFILHTPHANAAVQLHLSGAHNVHNAVAAAAVGYKAGLDIQHIADALRASQPVEGRSVVRMSKQGARIIDDSYNANPDSMLASLDAFASMQVEGKRIAVLGDMGELGSFAQAGHEAVGQKVANIAPDTLVAVGLLSDWTVQAAVRAGMPHNHIVHVEDAQGALDVLVGTLTQDDCVLVKASHSVGLDQVVEGLVRA